MSMPTAAGGSPGYATPRIPRHPVKLIDSPDLIIRRPQDALNAILSVAGIGLVLLLAVYAHGTTTGVTEDVASAVAKTARQILLVPVNVLQGLVATLVPIAVMIATLIRRRWRTTILIAGAGLLAALLTQLAVYLLQSSGPSALLTALSQPTLLGPRIVLSTYIATLAAILTTASAGTSSKTARASWYALTFVLFLAVIQGDQTLPGVLTALLLGRAVAYAVCYFAGVRSGRAWGSALIAGLRRAGLDPHLVMRLDEVDNLAAWDVTSTAPVGHVEGYILPTESIDASSDPEADAESSEHVTTLAIDGDAVVPDPLTDIDALRERVTSEVPATYRGAAHRAFVIWTDAALTERVDVIVLDTEQQVLGVLSNMWDAIRNRGLERRWAPSVKETAERALLMNHEARAAGVRTVTARSAAQVESSIIIPIDPAPPARELADIPDEDITDEMIADLWRQLSAAHRVGLAHHAITDRATVIDDDGQPWLLQWEDGEIAASDLVRRIDLAQLLTMTAMHVGPERALAVARDVVGDATLQSVTPLLQKAALPAHTRGQLRQHRDLLADLREALTSDSDTAATPIRLERVSVRTLVMVVIGVAAVIVVMGSLQISDVIDAVKNANPWWMVASFTCGLLTYVGSAIGLVAFTPEKIGVWRATLVQVAASIVSLVAPAGIGPAAMDLRFLTKARVPAALAGATVALTQVSRFVITVALLFIVALGSGSAGSISLPQLPTVLTVVGILAVAALAFVFPQVRTWVWEKIGPTLKQIWPHVLWAVGNPRRLAIAIAGNIIMTIGYVAAFGFALLAFGYTLSPITLAITFLISNSAGSVVPSPGGVGPVEVALTSGLALAGIPYATALSTTVIYRLLTFWGRVPLGWAALRYLEKHDAI